MSFNRTTAFGLGKWVIALGACAALAGCGTPRKPIGVYAVGNVGVEPIREAEILCSATPQFSFAEVPADQSVFSKPISQMAPGPYTFRWTTAAGKTFSRVLEPPREVPPDFKGQIYFQVAGEQVRLFVLPDQSDRTSNLPWSMPQAWETAPSIPGLNTY